MTNVVELKQRARLPHDAATRLREIADAIDRDEIRNAIVAYEWADDRGYQFVMPGTTYDSFALLGLLTAYMHDHAMKALSE